MKFDLLNAPSFPGTGGGYVDSLLQVPGLLYNAAHCRKTHVRGEDAAAR